MKQAYNKTTVGWWRDFFIAQKKYPEIFDYYKEDTNDYSDLDTINNSRWIHMNRHSNASMTYTSNSSEAMLGDSYYTYHSWNQVTDDDRKVAHSLIVPIFFDETQEDFFHEGTIGESLFDQGKFSYGCISKTADGNIIFKTTPNNGIGSPLYTELKQNGSDTSIEIDRRCGFDLHFTAPGMSYILPYAGYSPKVETYSNALVDGNYVLYPIDHWDRDLQNDAVKFVNKLYFGADTPKMNWDGTTFSLSELYTPLNKGNYNGAQMPFPEAPGRDDDETDIVYKINPKEQYNDWTPERKPYRINTSITNGSFDYAVPRLNNNLIPWEIYDSHTGIFIQDFNLTETEWSGTLWDLLGFTYQQFNSQTNNRLIKTTNKNKNNLQLLTTNAEINQGETKIYVQNGFGVPLYNNMMPMPVNFNLGNASGSGDYIYYPPLAQKTISNNIIAQRLPTRMIRGYYTIRSNIIQESSFIGGKKNNTTMPIVSIVDKIHGDGDFYFQQESGLEFVVTKPLRLASVSCSIHDPDGSYAKTSEQNTILFKIARDVKRTFNIAQEFLQEQQQQ